MAQDIFQVDIGALKLNSKRRKYRAEFGVNIGSRISPETFEEIEKLSRKFGIPKAQVVRRLMLRGLAEYHRDGMLPANGASGSPVLSHVV
jgi:hypothetical protein